MDVNKMRECHDCHRIVIVWIQNKTYPHPTCIDCIYLRNRYSLEPLGIGTLRHTYFNDN